MREEKLLDQAHARSERLRQSILRQAFEGRFVKRMESLNEDRVVRNN